MLVAEEWKTMEAKVMSLMGQNISMKGQSFSREWLISFKDPRELWTENWFALVLEILTVTILFQVFRNAKKNGPQSAYLILTAVCSVICFEFLPIIPREGYQLWWYHQSLANIMKQRVPSYVIAVYALVHYMAHNLTSKSNLPALTRSVATAVFATLVMFPCLWLAPRLLLILFHSDDPIFRDRIDGVPYIQILVLFLLFFHTSHLFHQNFACIEPQERNTSSYIKCAIQSALVSAMYTIVEQYLLYILFNLNMRLNTGICIIGALFILIHLARGEIKEMQMTSYSIQGIITPLLRKEWWVLVAALLLTSSLPMWINTENLKSTSDRLEMGPCHILHDVMNTSPLEVTRHRYICPDNLATYHFDFHCLPKKEIVQRVENRTRVYTICGKKFDKPQESAKMLMMYSVCCLALFYVAMLFSFTFKIQEKKMEENLKKVE